MEENINTNTCKGYNINCTNPIAYKNYKYCKDCYNKYYYNELRDNTYKDKYKIFKSRKYKKYRNELIREALLATAKNIY